MRLLDGFMKITSLVFFSGSISYSLICLPLTFLSVLVPSATSDVFFIMSQFIPILLENRALQIYDISVKLFVFVVDFMSYEYT